MDMKNHKKDSKFKDIPQKKAEKKKGEKAQGHCTLSLGGGGGSDDDGHPRTWEREPCANGLLAPVDLKETLFVLF